MVKKDRTGTVKGPYRYGEISTVQRYGKNENSTAAERQFFLGSWGEKMFEQTQLFLFIQAFRRFRFSQSRGLKKQYGIDRKGILPVTQGNPYNPQPVTRPPLTN